MRNLNLWKNGDNVLLRGMYNHSPVYVQSVRVVKDAPEETALFIWPGAECVAPSRSISNRQQWGMERWKETLSGTLQVERFVWRANRFLILLKPEKFYSTIYIWDETSGEFICYYINFQLPFRRTPLGFDTLDLDLDLVIDPSYNWEWKDEAEYKNGIRTGGIRPEWVREIERAKSEVFQQIEKKAYPLDGSWLNFQPDPTWSLPYLPKSWDESNF